MILLKTKYEWVVLFILLMLFSHNYFCFFPGGFTMDSYISYNVALTGKGSVDVFSPFYGLVWKVFGANNYTPFIIDYILFIMSMLILCYKLRTATLSIVILILFLLPCYFLTYIFAWKDNLLLSFFCLLISLLVSSNKKHCQSGFKIFIVFSILCFMCMLRVNAIFLILPFLIYVINKYLLIRKVSKVFIFVLVLIVFYSVNYLITYKIMDSSHSMYIQQFYVTDIAKINYAQHKPLGIPKEFLTNDQSQVNIDKVFSWYEGYKSNDYFYYKLNESFTPLFKIVEDYNSNTNIKSLWISTIMQNPFIYLQIRISQWLQAMSNVNYLFFIPFDQNYVKNFNSYLDKFYYNNQYMNNIQKKIYSPAKVASSSIHLISVELLKPYISFLINIFVILFVLIDKKIYSDKMLILTCALSGFLYSLAYIPILPSGDYRYFNCSILAAVVSLTLIFIRRRSIHYNS